MGSVTLRPMPRWSMLRPTLLCFALTACGSGNTRPAKTGPQSPRTGTDAASPTRSATAHTAPTAAHDLAEFAEPFGWVPLREAYIRQHALRKVVREHDVDTENARLMSADVETFEFGRDGRLVAARRVARGQLRSSRRLSYEGAQLIRETTTHPKLPLHDAISTKRYDDAGKLTQWTLTQNGKTRVLTHSYDGRGRLRRVEGAGGVEQYVYAAGQLVRTTFSSEYKRIEKRYGYDDGGRLVALTSTNKTGRVDTYAFVYAPSGQLRSLTLHEDGKPIYRRSYRYDEEGMLIAERLTSFVPAMGHGTTFHYRYERHDDPPSREAEPANKSHTPLEVASAAHAAFPGSYLDLADVAFEIIYGKDKPKSVTLLIPEAIVGRQSDADLKRQACDAKARIGYSCDCETVKRGAAIDAGWSAFKDKRVVPITLSFNLGC